MNRKIQANQLARECIVMALIQLADQKPFSAITVSELTKRAGVSRMTYYRNYTSKEEVFESFMKEIVEWYKEEVELLKKADCFGEYERFLHCLRYFVKYKEFIKCITKIGMGKLLLDALSSYLTETYFGDRKLPTEVYYFLHAYEGVLLTVYLAWLENGEKDPLEVLAQIVYIQTKSGAEISRKYTERQKEGENS